MFLILLVCAVLPPQRPLPPQAPRPPRAVPSVASPSVCPICKGEGTIDLPFGGCTPCADCKGTGRVVSTTPPCPDGVGWQWDANGRFWWKTVAVQPLTFQPVTAAPVYAAPVMMSAPAVCLPGRG